MPKPITDGIYSLRTNPLFNRYRRTNSCVVLEKKLRTEEYDQPTSTRATTMTIRISVNYENDIGFVDVGPCEGENVGS
jgi:hypothetical protein